MQTSVQTRWYHRINLILDTWDPVSPSLPSSHQVKIPSASSYDLAAFVDVSWMRTSAMRLVSIGRAKWISTICLIFGRSEGFFNKQCSIRHHILSLIHGSSRRFGHIPLATSHMIRNCVSLSKGAIPKNSCAHYHQVPWKWINEDTHCIIKTTNGKHVCLHRFRCISFITPDTMEPQTFLAHAEQFWGSIINRMCCDGSCHSSFNMSG